MKKEIRADDLKAFYNEHTAIETAKMLGVSVSTLRVYLRFSGIKLKGRGNWQLKGIRKVLINDK